MQLASKMRFIAAQFEALLSDELWLRNASHANAMAQRLAAAVADVGSIQLARPVQANAVFARLPRHMVAELQKHFYFYVWDEMHGQDCCEVRWMTHFDTTDADVENFVKAIRALAKEN
jgi:threonine aldolase